MLKYTNDERVTHAENYIELELHETVTRMIEKFKPEKFPRSISEKTHKINNYNHIKKRARFPSPIRSLSIQGSTYFTDNHPFGFACKFSLNFVKVVSPDFDTYFQTLIIPSFDLS